MTQPVSAVALFLAGKLQSIASTASHGLGKSKVDSVKVCSLGPVILYYLQ